MDMTKIKAMAASYARGAVTAVAAIVVTGNWAWNDLGKAALAGLIPVLLRWVNKNDIAYGVGSA